MKPPTVVIALMVLVPVAEVVGRAFVGPVPDDVYGRGALRLVPSPYPDPVGVQTAGGHVVALAGVSSAASSARATLSVTA